MSTTSAQPESALEHATECPAQQTFTEAEQKFLQNFLDNYLAAESSNTKKGDKKHWVKEHVYYKYITEFKSDGPSGPNLSSVRSVYYLHISQEQATD
jgi:hypothetical protein